MNVWAVEVHKSLEGWTLEADLKHWGPSSSRLTVEDISYVDFSLSLVTRVVGVSESSESVLSR